MPRLTGNQLPMLRLHKPTGKAVVTLNGKHCYCGKYGTAESTRRYNQLLAEWLANGRRVPSASSSSSGDGNGAGLTIVELCERYLDDRRAYFAGPNGKPARSFLRIKAIVKCLLEHYACLPAEQFGPLKLRAMRESLIKPEVTRNYINEIISDIRTMFKWASSLEFVPVSVYQSLCTVAALKSGKTLARESQPVRPIDEMTLAATVEQMPEIIADMTMLQRHCGARPTLQNVIRSRGTADDLMRLKLSRSGVHKSLGGQKLRMPRTLQQTLEQIVEHTEGWLDRCQKVWLHDESPLCKCPKSQ